MINICIFTSCHRVVECLVDEGVRGQDDTHAVVLLEVRAGLDHRQAAWQGLQYILIFNT